MDNTQNADVFVRDNENNDFKPTKKSNLALGILGAILGSVVGIAIWVGLAAVGFYAAIAALAVAYGAKKGYEIGRGPNTKSKFYVILIVTILALIIAEYLALYLQILPIVKAYNIKNPNEIIYVSFWNTLPFVFSVFSYFVIDFIIFFAFSTMGIVGIIKQTKAEVFANAPTIKTSNFNEETNKEFNRNFDNFQENKTADFDMKEKENAQMDFDAEALKNKNYEEKHKRNNKKDDDEIR